MKKFVKSKLAIEVIIPSLIATFIVVGIVSATTIGTNISTGGTLSVTDTSTLSGDTTVGGTLGVTGATTLNGNATFGNANTDVNLFTGTLQASTTALFTATTTFYNTLDMRGGNKGLIFGASSDGSAIERIRGTVYYDTTNSVLKMSDGTTWYTVGTSTSGITLSGGKLQLADLATQYMTIGTTTQQGLSVLTVEATSTTAIPLSLVARISQTANLFQVKNSVSSNLLYVNASGGLFASSTLQVTGVATMYDNIKVSPAYGIDTLSAGTLNIGTTTANAITIGKSGVTTTFPGNTSVTGTDTVTNASTTRETIGDGTTINGFLFGTCSVDFGTSIVPRVATTTNCTATGVTTDYKVFMTPINLEQDINFSNASTTGNNVIQVQVFNNATSTITTAAHTWNWMAIK